MLVANMMIDFLHHYLQFFTRTQFFIPSRLDNLKEMCVLFGNYT